MTISSGTSLLDSARELAPLIRQHSEYGDIHGKLAPEVVDGFHDSNIYGMWVPKELGGVELDPISSLELVELISYEDAAAGWLSFAATVGQGAAGFYLPDAGAQDVFAGDRMAVVVGQASRAGTAVPAEGGYRLTGTWNFASGAPQASHIITLALVEGTHEPRLFVLPIDEVELDEESWDVLGLRGTGSWDYSTEDVFVPEDHTFSGLEIQMRGGDMGKLGLVHVAVIGHSAWALGVGRRLLDELSTKIRAKAGRAGAQSGSDSLHEQFGIAEAKLRAARAFSHETYADVWDTVTSGKEISTRQATLMRLSLHNATWTAKDVGTFVYDVAGTSALRDGDLQRFYRDLHGGTQHIMSSPPVVRNAGRELAGIAEGEIWIAQNLVDPASM